MRNSNIKREKKTLQGALDYVEELAPVEKNMLIEIVKKRNIEQRRNEIAQNAHETLQAVREKKAYYGDINDLKKDMQ